MSSDGKTFDCICGIRSDESGNQTLWIESCRTGQRLSLGGGWFAELEQAAPRLLARVVKARSEGRSRVVFTLAELLAYSALAEHVARKLAERGKPGPSSFSRLGYKHH
jgi:hypothetical protein